MRKSIVVLIVAVLAVAAGAVVLSLSAPVLDEEVEYRLTSLYYRGQEISSQVDGDEVLDLLEGASRGLISRGGLPAHSFRDMVEVNVIGERRPCTWYSPWRTGSSPSIRIRIGVMPFGRVRRWPPRWRRCCPHERTVRQPESTPRPSAAGCFFLFRVQTLAGCICDIWRSTYS